MSKSIKIPSRPDDLYSQGLKLLTKIAKTATHESPDNIQLQFDLLDALYAASKGLPAAAVPTDATATLCYFVGIVHGMALLRRDLPTHRACKRFALMALRLGDIAFGRAFVERSP